MKLLSAHPSKNRRSIDIIIEHDGEPHQLQLTPSDGSGLGRSFTKKAMSEIIDVIGKHAKKSSEKPAPIRSSGAKRTQTDIVVTKHGPDDYRVHGGPREAMFSGGGKNMMEAIGQWVISNREAINFTMAVVEDGETSFSTINGVPRSKDELGPHEMRAMLNIGKNHETETDKSATTT